jgi:hypothetical protein
MRRVRIPIAAVMAGVALFAVDGAIVRSLLASDSVITVSPTTALDLACFAFGVLPMATVLLLVALVQVARCLRSGEPASFFVGFEVLGWASVFLFIVISALSPPLIGAYTDATAKATGPFFKPYGLEHAPAWVVGTLEFGLVTLIFGVPQMLVALMGGVLARWSGLSVTIERRR